MKISILFVAITGLLLSASIALGFGNLGTDVNNFCQSQPYTGDCALCHSGGFSNPTPAKSAIQNNDLCFFCPNDPSCLSGPTCTDADGDMYFAEGGSCGPQDCNDNNPAINPGAAEHCSDNIDNNCDGLTDGQDSLACPAPSPACTDADQDGFFAQAGCNTMQDCDDFDNLVFPGATEICVDGVDNDCDGMIDEGCNTSVDDGQSLYRDNCASCHRELPDSDVCGESAEDILEAIAENEGGMAFLSSLSDAQIKSIADALKNCQHRTDEYDSDEYDSDGYDSDRYDSDRHDSDRHDSDGYDSDGYDSDGYDSDRHDSD